MATTPVQIESPVRTGQFTSRGRPLRLTVLERWHLYSLDAPSVAVCWMLLFDRGAPVRELLPQAVGLAIAVWTIYVLDRLLDARKGREVLQQRHLVHWRQRRVLMAMLLAAGGVLAATLPMLSAGLRLAWPLLAGPLLAYAALVHVWRLPRLPKPLGTALFFAMAVPLPAELHVHSRLHLLPAVILFGGLCWWNCVLIDKWEGGPCEQAPVGNLAVWLGVLVFGAAAGLCVAEPGPLVFACALSALLLFALHTLRDRFSPVKVRALADAALLTPLLFFVRF